MPGFLSNLLRLLRERRGTDMDFLCHHLLSERGEASQTVLAQEIIKAYRAMNAGERRNFFAMLGRKFGPDETAVLGAAAAYQRTPGIWQPFPRPWNRHARSSCGGSIQRRRARRRWWLGAGICWNYPPRAGIFSRSTPISSIFSGPGSIAVSCAWNESPGRPRL